MARKKPANLQSTKRREQKKLPAAPAAGKIGKGVPPVHTRFPKGVSGNRKGRPKGSKNLSTILIKAANAPVTATINGKSRKISRLEATAMQLATKAAGGDHKAMGKFLDCIKEIQAQAAAARPTEFPFGPEDLEVLKAVYARMKLCEPTGKDG